MGKYMVSISYLFSYCFLKRSTFHTIFSQYQLTKLEDQKGYECSEHNMIKAYPPC